MFMLHTRLPALPGRRDELLALMIEPADGMPGCRLYVVAVDDSDGDAVWVTELWESESAHADSLRDEAVQQRIQQAMPLVERGGIRQQRLDAWAGVPAAGDLRSDAE